MLAFFTVLSVLLLTLADQLFKHFAVLFLKGQPPLVVVPHVLQLRYTENTGAMMGMLQGRTVLMAVLAGLVFLLLAYLIASKKVRFGFLYCCLVAVLSGGLGNLIDRVFRGFVVDYIEVLFVQFYIFNFADCLITVGAFLIVFYELAQWIREAKKQKETNHG